MEIILVHNRFKVLNKKNKAVHISNFFNHTEKHKTKKSFNDFIKKVTNNEQILLNTHHKKSVNETETN